MRIRHRALGASVVSAALTVVSQASAQDAPPPPDPVAVAPDPGSHRGVVPAQGTPRPSEPAAVPPDSGSHRGIHYGAGVALGFRVPLDPGASGPWIEGAFSLDIGLTAALYIRLEPGLAWYSFGPNSGEPNLGFTSVNGLARGANSTENNWQFTFLVRSTIGIDLGPWVTVRVGPILGVTTAHVSSELCNDSAQNFVYGATVAPEVRFGPRHRIEVGPQLDFVWLRSPYCVYPNFDTSQPSIPHASDKPTVNVLLHASFHFW